MILCHHKYDKLNNWYSDVLCTLWTAWQVLLDLPPACHSTTCVPGLLTCLRAGLLACQPACSPGSIGVFLSACSPGSMAVFLSACSPGSMAVFLSACSPGSMAVFLSACSPGSMAVFLAACSPGSIAVFKPACPSGCSPGSYWPRTFLPTTSLTDCSPVWLPASLHARLPGCLTGSWLVFLPLVCLPAFVHNCMLAWMLALKTSCLPTLLFDWSPANLRASLPVYLHPSLSACLPCCFL